MVNKKALLGALMIFLALIAIFHTTAQLAVYGTGIPDFYQTGISGFSVGDFEIGEDTKNLQPYSETSKIILAAEWFLLLTILTITLAKNKIANRREFGAALLKKRLSEKRQKNRTDLDMLYDILKEKKHLHLKTISRLFKVEKKIAKNWCETLEAADLAFLSYPRFGDPELILSS